MQKVVCNNIHNDRYDFKQFSLKMKSISVTIRTTPLQNSSGIETYPIMASQHFDSLTCTASVYASRNNFNVMFSSYFVYPSSITGFILEKYINVNDCRYIKEIIIDSFILFRDLASFIRDVSRHCDDKNLIMNFHHYKLQRISTYQSALFIDSIQTKSYLRSSQYHNTPHIAIKKYFTIQDDQNFLLDEISPFFRENPLERTKD